jgi:hypothetical protein
MVEIRLGRQAPLSVVPLSYRGLQMRTHTSGSLIRLLHDYESDGKPRMLMPGYNVNYAVPETKLAFNNTEGYAEFVPLTRPWQYFWYEQIQLALDGFNVPDGVPDKWFIWDYSGDTKGKKKYVAQGTAGATPEYPLNTLKGVWQFLTEDHRALTDNNSIKQGRADYILGINVGNAPIAIKRLDFGGNVRVKKNYQDIDNANIRANYWAVEALDASKAPPSLLWLMENEPHKIGWCVEATPDKYYDGTYVCSWFPPMKNWGVSTPYPFLSPRGWNYLLKTQTASISNNVSWSPLNPPR